MSSKPFVHLHLHSHYSMLDGMIDLKGLCERTKFLNMDSVAVTDHGNMFGAVAFYKAAKAAGIKPIIGLEAYIAPESRLNHSLVSQHTGDSITKYYHLVLLVKNETGYKNLIKIASSAYLDGFYYRPRIDMDLLQQYHEGLICLSACLAGEVPKMLTANRLEDAKEVMRQFKSIFGDDYYFEIMRHGIEEQNIVIERGVPIARELGIPIVATNDCHYLRKEDVELHNIILNVQSKTGEALREYETGEFYVKSSDEMYELFKDLPEACENAKKIADQCSYDFKFGELHFPKVDLPAGLTEDEYLAQLAWEGFKRRYPNEKPEGEVGKRLEYELSVVKNMGFPGYFLVVQDFTVYAKDVLKMEVGCARGSVGGSVVAYCLRITELDPIKYELMFERFLNPERISMPDIDMDFPESRRHEIIKYVTEKYGEECVSQIVTINYMKARTSVKDVARVLRVPIHKAEKMSKSINPIYSLKELLDKRPDDEAELAAFKDAAIAAMNEDEETKSVARLALRIEGSPRQTGVHAAGVVISDKPLYEYVPLAREKESVTTQYTMDLLEPLGLLKMDFLGLRTMDVLRNTVDLIEQRHGVKVDIHNLPMDDVKTCQMLSDGFTKGVFQSDSSGICKLIKEIAPKSMFDCVPIVALYRPGPLESGMVDTYLACRHGKQEAKPFYSSISKITQDTYHQFLYQEQIMQSSQVLSGFSIGEADELRKAIGKKDQEKLSKLRKKFVEGAIKQNPADPKVGEIANDLYSKIEFFGRYCFNKAHSAAYGLIMYQTAYLKANYPVEYMCCLIASVINKEDQFVSYLRETKRMGIHVMPPCVNKSQESFSVESATRIRYGLIGIKGLASAAEQILTARQSGEFVSFYDFLERVKLHSGVLKALAQSGALDCFGFTRKTLVEKIESKITDKVAKVLKERAQGQMDMFAEEGDTFTYGKIEEVPEYPEKEMLAEEKRLLGAYLAKHPIDKYKSFVSKIGDLKSASQCHEADDGTAVVLACIVSGLKTTTTKKGDMMAFLEVEDGTGNIEAIVFPKVFSNFQNSLSVDNVVLLEAHVQSDSGDSHEDGQDDVMAKSAKLIVIGAFNLEKMERDKRKYQPSADFIQQKKRKGGFKRQETHHFGGAQTVKPTAVEAVNLPTGVRIFVKPSSTQILSKYIKQYGKPGAMNVEICVGKSGSGGVIVALPNKMDLRSLEPIFKLSGIACELRYAQ
jgi:DNA polymerase III subunit alpha